MKYDLLLNAEENWQTDMGAWFPGEAVVVRDKDLFTDFNDTTWMGYLMYVITGRKLSDQQIALFDGMWKLCVSYPDPRLWNNRVSALAATTRSTGVLGVAAGVAVSEATVYGNQATRRAYDFLTRMKLLKDSGEDLKTRVFAELKEKRFLGGFGRPLVRQDERIEPLLGLLDDLGIERGPHVSLVLEINELVNNSRYRISMNIAALVAAIACDQGLTIQEFYDYQIVSFSAGNIACNIDALKHPEGSFFPLRCSRINYKGVKPRKWNT